MASQKLMPERISYTEIQPLLPEDITLMKDKIFRQLIIYLPGYLLLMGIGIYIWLRGPEVLHDRDSFPLEPLQIDEETKTNFWTVAPYFCIFLFLLSTIFFGRYYFQSLHPIVKDIKKRKKSLIFYKPKKSAMAFFNRYYLSTPLFEKQQIEVSREDFESIGESDLLCLESGPESNFILSLRNGEKKINFY